MPKQSNVAYVPGLKASAGMQTRTLFPDDDYVFEVKKSEMKPTEKGTGSNFSLQLKVLDCKKSDNSGLIGKTYFHSIFLMGESHEKYDQDMPNGGKYQDIGVGELKSLIEATGVNIGKNDSFDPDAFVGKTFVGKIRTQKPKEGSDDEPRNKISQYMVDKEAKE